MFQVHRKGDLSTGDGHCPGVPPLTYSPDVFANNLNVVRYSDIRSEHGCPLPGHVPHTGVYSGISGHTTFANDLAIQHVGDPIIDPIDTDYCGQHSPDVFVT